jgi:hypothetical protein
VPFGMGTLGRDQQGEGDKFLHGGTGLVGVWDTV